MRSLIEMTDASAREELGDYYIVSKSRMENLLRCFEGGRARVAELTAIVKNQQDEIANLSKSIITLDEPEREMPKCTRPNDTECHAHSGDKCYNYFQCEPAREES